MIKLISHKELYSTMAELADDHEASVEFLSKLRYRFSNKIDSEYCDEWKGEVYGLFAGAVENIEYGIEEHEPNIIVNGDKLKDFERTVPSDGDIVFIPLLVKPFYSSFEWRHEREYQIRIYNQGLLYKSADDAVERALSMLKYSIED